MGPNQFRLRKKEMKAQEERGKKDTEREGGWGLNYL